MTDLRNRNRQFVADQLEKASATLNRREWYCPNCDVTDTTHEARPHTRFHTCSGLRGLTAPLLPVGTKAKVEAHDREDYVGTDLVPVDEDGRPVMSIVTTRDDGQDVVVFASTATADAKEIL